MSKAKISIIAAIAKNHAIGRNNQLLWHIPADMQRFKDITSGHPVIMGSRTYESIGKKLPNRLNIVLVKDLTYNAPGCTLANSLEGAIAIAQKNDQSEIFIIGGGSVYAQAISLADKLYLTVIDKEYDADTFFPDYSAFKKVIYNADKEFNGLRYKFLNLER